MHLEIYRKAMDKPVQNFTIMVNTEIDDLSIPPTYMNQSKRKKKKKKKIDTHNKVSFQSNFKIQTTILSVTNTIEIFCKDLHGHTVTQAHCTTYKK